MKGEKNVGLYVNDNGQLKICAGRGKAEYGASTVRKGTATYTGAGISSYPVVNVTFDTPMPDADYEIFFDYDESSGHGEMAYMGFFGVYKRTANGFQILFSDQAAISIGWNIKYTAFKLYTDNEYNGLLQLSRPDLWPVNTEIDFGNGLYGQRFTGTITAAANAGNTVHLYATHVKVYQFGGWVQYANNGGTMQLAYNENSGYAFSLYSAPSGGLSLFNLSSSARTNAPYDIWCTYHKV